MHPEVISGTPGDCPICHMALELESGAEENDGAQSRSETGDARSTLAVSYEARALLRNAFGPVRRRILSKELRLSAWLERPGALSALVPTDDVASLPEHATGTFFSSRAPDLGVGVQRTSDAPLAWDRALTRLHFETLSNATPIEAGAVGWIAIEPRDRTELVVPDTAVIQGPNGPYVLSVSNDGHWLERRRIELGRIFSGFAVVTAGLDERDLVLFKNTFFLNAERRLRGQRTRGP
jgi:hypothetical protein